MLESRRRIYLFHQRTPMEKVQEMGSADSWISRAVFSVPSVSSARFVFSFCLRSERLSAQRLQREQRLDRRSRARNSDHGQTAQRLRIGRARDASFADN